MVQHVLVGLNCLHALLQVCDGSMFSTAVSEEQLEEAREKSRRRLFGSSRIFELEEDKKDRLELCGRSIIELRAAEQ